MIRWSPALPPRPGCPHRRLRRLLARQLPPGLTLRASLLKPWASANFVGARHIFPCASADDDAASTGSKLQSRLGAMEWVLPGHIVADVVVEVAAPSALRIEILTVED